MTGMAFAPRFSFLGALCAADGVPTQKPGPADPPLRFTPSAVRIVAVVSLPALWKGRFRQLHPTMWIQPDALSAASV
jgi:hypothetical protein